MKIQKSDTLISIARLSNNIKNVIGITPEFIYDRNDGYNNLRYKVGSGEGCSVEDLSVGNTGRELYDQINFANSVIEKFIIIPKNDDLDSSGTTTTYHLGLFLK